MSTSPEPRPKPRKTGKATYRGVTLRTPAAASRFTSGEIKRAVEHALEKHADSLKANK